MHFNDAQAERITDHQVCVVYDKKTGTIAHIHQSITFEGAEAPTKEQFEALGERICTRIRRAAQRLIPVASKRSAPRKAKRRAKSRKP